VVSKGLDRAERELARGHPRSARALLSLVDIDALIDMEAKTGRLVAVERRQQHDRLKRQLAREKK
jgi:hypothetical protein